MNCDTDALPFLFTSVDVDATTPVTIDLPDVGVSKVVATLVGEDGYFTVTSTPPTVGVGHVMKDSINYTFTVTEWRNFSVIAAANTAVLAVTFYK